MVKYAKLGSFRLDGDFHHDIRILKLKDQACKLLLLEPIKTITAAWRASIAGEAPRWELLEMLLTAVNIHVEAPKEEWTCTSVPTQPRPSGQSGTCIETLSFPCGR